MGNSEISGQLRSWWKTHLRGRNYDSHGGFFLPDGSMLNPDAAYVLPQKLKGLTKDDLTGLPYLCPDFIIELLSTSDSLPKAQQKMERWMENGVALGWLIDPYRRGSMSMSPAARQLLYPARRSREVAPSKALPSTWTRFGAALRSKLRGDNRS